MQTQNSNLTHNNHQSTRNYHASLYKHQNKTLKNNSNRCISMIKTDVKKIQNMAGYSQKVVQAPKQLTYFLGKGNNEGLVRRVMDCRGTWVQTENSTSAFLNLRWQQDQKGMRYERLIDSGLYRSLFNQFQFQEVICNKELLFRNMNHYCQKNNVNIWKIVPPTYLLSIRDDCNLQYCKQFLDTYDKYAPGKVKERVTSNEEMQIKLKIKRLFCNSNMKKLIGKPPPIREEFLDQNGEYLWIVKPTFLNRGRGIQVFSKLNTLFKFLSDNIQGYQEKSLCKDQEESPTKIDYIKRNSEQIQLSVMMRDPANREIKEKREESFFDGNQYIRVIPKVPATIKTDRFLVQKYLEKPMLIKNRKFDIRIWVLVTHNLRCYVFKQGYVRLSSLEYACTDSQDNNFMHLTNNAVQKFSNSYGSVADGNQLSFKALALEMENNNLNFQECKETIYGHIRISLKSTVKLLNPSHRKFCFQIFGYDFMIDRSGHPWLLEVNNNPCIEQSSQLLCSLIPRMLDDAFRIAVDPLFYGSVSAGRFKVEGYSDTNNMWQNLNIDSQ